VVLARHWAGNGVKRHRRVHQEWEELAKSVCLEGHTTFASLDSNCSTWCRVEKGEQESGNEMKYMWNELKSWGYL
jgi:hypothetical protein